MKYAPKFLHDLARFIQVMSVDQVARAHFNGDRAIAQRALENAKAKGLIAVTTELIRPRETSEPIAVVRPGEPPPSPEHVAYVARTRWSESETPTIVARATTKLCAFLGGERHGISYVSHQIALAEVFLQKRAIDPQFEWSLVRQTSLAGALPDAIAAGVMIELVGRYSGATVAAKIEMAGSATLELW